MGVWVCDVIFLSFFAAKYREYHQLYESGKFVSAGKLLVTLLLSNTVPTRYMYMCAVQSHMCISMCFMLMC